MEARKGPHKSFLGVFGFHLDLRCTLPSSNIEPVGGYPLKGLFSGAMLVGVRVMFEMHLRDAQRSLLAQRDIALTRRARRGRDAVGCRFGSRLCRLSHSLSSCSFHCYC